MPDVADVESTDAAVERVRRYFDEAVESEWGRMADSVEGRVSFEVHRRFLQPFLRPGMHVLEVGAGPGRFTREMVALGARVEVTDLSTSQLEANRARAEADGFAHGVTGWRQLDVRDVSGLDDDAFDLVLAYGGPLSYVFDHAEEALRGLLRVTAPQGHVVASVMSMLGAYRFFLPAVLELTDEENAHILATGDLRPSQPEGHVAQLYRARDVQALVAAAGGELVAASASHWASLDHQELLAGLEQDPVRWASFLGHEVAMAAEPGALDGGTHILFAARQAP
jgi:ubiquinone/menaquinone biosynthesis C-methylase UbiE